MVSRFGAVGLIVLLLGGCSRDAPTDNGSTAGNDSGGVAPPTVRNLSAAEQLSRAFVAAFGQTGSARRTAGDETYDFRPDRLEWIGNKAVLISLGENVQDFHVSSGTMAVHYLVPATDSFLVTGGWLDAAGGGTFGAPPQALAVRRDMTDYPVVYSEGGGTWQGYTCTWAYLVELGPDRPIESGPIPLSYSNAGAVIPEEGRTLGGEAPREVQGRIGNVQRNRGFDVQFTGTERFVEHYDYHGNRFARNRLESRAVC